jgi:opacity protein-like surface antigen
MNRLLMTLVCLAFAAPAVFAQNDKRAEFFIGYSNLQAEGITDVNDPASAFDDDFFDRRKGLNGVNGSLTGFLNSRFGIKGDFSYHQTGDTETLPGGGRSSLDTRVIYFMGGPVFKFRNAGRVEPFVHALAGGANTRFDASLTTPITGGTIQNSFDVSSTDFAAAIGGGVDIRLGDKFSLRAIQFDYTPVFLRDRSINVLGGAGAIQPFTLEGQRADNIRISVGIVF